MIYINPDSISPGAAWEKRASDLTTELKRQPDTERSKFIEDHRDETWGHPTLLKALRAVVGNKCWYSEVPLEGADPNVDHFRPKGRVREVDENLQDTKRTSPGYWWLAFEPRNFRLASMHSNQRRVNKNTSGGKSDYFPIRGERAPEGTDWGCIVEDVLALDPCSASDVALLWFDPDGNPCIASWRDKPTSAANEERVRVTIWLYHLDKVEIQTKRAQHVEDIRKDLLKANVDYMLWDSTSATPNIQAKNSFDKKVAEIKKKIDPKAEFAGAKQCAVRAAMADYQWIEEVNIT
jgi:hypothetical protein